MHSYTTNCLNSYDFSLSRPIYLSTLVCLVYIAYYPRMPIGKVWIYRLLFVCFSVFVRLWISSPRIKLATSNFARRYIGVQGRESHILGNFAPTEAKNRTNRPARGPRPPACKRNAREAPFVKSRARVDVGIGMCGYTSVPLTYVLVKNVVVFICVDKAAALN